MYDLNYSDMDKALFKADYVWEVDNYYQKKYKIKAQILCSDEGSFCFIKYERMKKVKFPPKKW